MHESDQGAATIEDPADRRLDAFRHLKDAASRSDGRFIAESELVVRRVIERGWSVESLLLSPTRHRRLAAALAEHGLLGRAIVAPQEVIDDVVGFPLHRGVLALVRRPQGPDEDAALASWKRIVVLEDVVDPDNVGAVFRHAAAFGAEAVVLSPHAGDPLYRKAVRTSMGLVLSIPFLRMDDRSASGAAMVWRLHAYGYTTVALTPAGDSDLREASSLLRRADRLALLVGTEAEGLRADTLAAASVRVRIPMRDGVDSLNAATAAAIALYELVG